MHPFLAACHRRPTAFTPVWLMRQAGRFLPEYRAIRERIGFLELCRTPDVAAEVTLLPVEKLGVDAAILFADILLLVEPLGVGLEFSRGEGPVIRRPVRSAADVERLVERDPAETVPFVFETVRRVRAALGERVPLIGFAGAPFTVASYLVEGGASRDYLETKRLMYGDPGAWRALLTLLARTTARYLNGQIAAGAQAVQLFDSWVGALGPDDYRAFALPYTRADPGVAHAGRARDPLRDRDRGSARGAPRGGRRRHRARLAPRAGRGLAAGRPRRRGPGEPRPGRAASRRPPRSGGGRPRSSRRPPAGRATSSTSATACCPAPRSTTSGRSSTPSMSCPSADPAAGSWRGLPPADASRRMRGPKSP